MMLSNVTLLSGLLILAPINSQAECNPDQCRDLLKGLQQELYQANFEINRLNFKLAAAKAMLAAKQQELIDALAKLNALTSIEQSLEEKPEGEQSP